MVSSEADHIAPTQDSRVFVLTDEQARDEIEAKFLIEDTASVAQVIDALRAHNVQSVFAVDVVDRYWDTLDWCLLKEGWTYRWREASGRKSLTLKSVEPIRDVVHRRREVEQRVAAFPESDYPIPFGPVAEQLRRIRPGELGELFRVHNYRRLFNIRTPLGALVEIAIDQATITATDLVSETAPGRMPFVELEMELKEGPEESLRQLVDDMHQEFRLLPSRLNKFDRGLQTAGLSEPAEIRKRRLNDSPLTKELRERNLSPADPAIQLAYQCLQERFEEMLAEEPKAWEGLDPEGVHQMRVATRRLRAAFRAFKDVLPAKPILAYNREFRRAAAVLGEVRDLDVYQDNLKHYAAEIPAGDAAHLNDYQQHLTEQRRNARKRLVAYLTSRRYCRLKDRFARFLERGPSRRAMNAHDATTICDAVRQLVARRYSRVLRDGRAIRYGVPDESYHALRIQCKRLRYLFEFFQPIYGKALRPAIKRLKKLQDVLGEFQDACAATDQLREYADRVSIRAGHRGQLIALGQLMNGQRRQAEGRRGDFGDAWKRFDCKGRRKRILAAFGASPSVSAKMKTRRPRRDEPPSVTTTNADPSGVCDSVSPSSEGRRILPDHVTPEMTVDLPQGHHRNR